MTLPYRYSDNGPADPTRADRDAEAQREYDQLRQAVELVQQADSTIGEAVALLEQAYQIADGIGVLGVGGILKRLALALEMIDVQHALDVLEDEAPR